MTSSSVAAALVAAQPQAQPGGAPFRRRAAPVVPWNIRSGRTPVNEATLEYKPQQLAAGSRPLPWRPLALCTSAEDAAFVDAVRWIPTGDNADSIARSSCFSNTPLNSGVSECPKCTVHRFSAEETYGTKWRSADTGIAAFPAVCGPREPAAQRRHVPPMPGDLCTSRRAAGRHGLRTPSGVLCASGNRVKRVRRVCAFVSDLRRTTMCGLVHS